MVRNIVFLATFGVWRRSNCSALFTELDSISRDRVSFPDGDVNLFCLDNLLIAFYFEFGAFDRISRSILNISLREFKLLDIIVGWYTDKFDRLLARSKMTIGIKAPMNLVTSHPCKISPFR